MVNQSNFINSPHVSSRFLDFENMQESVYQIESECLKLYCWKNKLFCCQAAEASCCQCEQH